jgi:hypothetical protein
LCELIISAWGFPSRKTIVQALLMSCSSFNFFDHSCVHNSWLHFLNNLLDSTCEDSFFSLTKLLV